MASQNQNQNPNSRRSSSESYPSTQEQQNNQDSAAAPILQTLLGPAVSSWPYSESTLIHALALRTEQEKTKQDYYKTETLNRSFELIKYATSIGIPPQFIPLIFAGSADPSNINELISQMKLQSVPIIPPPTPPQRQAPSLGDPFQRSTQPLQGKFTPHHQRSATVSNNSNDFSSPNPMASYRFGGNSVSASSSPVSARPPKLEYNNNNMFRKSTLTPKQQMSPAKLGAQAVASLAGPSRYPYHPQPSPSSHSRHSSLPPKVSIPETEALDFSSARKKQQTSTSTIAPINASQKMHQMSTIIETKKAQPPSIINTNSNSNSSTPVASQESMTQQHHFIQFHHWKPSHGGDSSMPTPPVSSHSASSSASSFISTVSNSAGTSGNMDTDSHLESSASTIAGIASPAKRRRSSSATDHSKDLQETLPNSPRSEEENDILETPKKIPRSQSTQAGLNLSLATTPTKQNETLVVDDKTMTTGSGSMSVTSTPLRTPNNARRFPDNILS